ncbi:DUF1617 family protein [Marinilactibacillus psychrotolerans]|uniref:DUF1617 family protein n=1 Tax=Marinilactibacillus psychrotolerans TaxID=191770 RepID=UPI003888AF6A
MKILAKNKDLYGMIQFLNDMSVKGKASLGRTKLKDKLIKKQKEYGEDESAVAEEFGTFSDDQQTHIKWNDGQAKEGQDALQELGEKEVEVNLLDYAKWATPLKEKILNFDEEISGFKADGWAILIENLEEDKEEEK